MMPNQGSDGDVVAVVIDGVEPEIRPMSTRRSGDSSRIFINGSKLIPPDSTLAKAASFRADTASSMLAGATYSNDLGYIL
jgi:hypothetical protein